MKCILNLQETIVIGMVQTNESLALISEVACFLSLVGAGETLKK